MKETDVQKDSLIREVPGDLVFEGRMGNSIRLGSRNKFPILTLCNRGEDVLVDAYERTINSSLLSMMQRGTIHDNFELGPSATSGRGQPGRFKTSNDIRTTGLIAEGLEAKYGFGDASSTTTNLYDYTFGSELNSGNQMLIRSGRITIDSSEDSIFISSMKGIILGGGEKVVVRANKSIHFESELFVFGGNHDTYEYEAEVNGDDYQPMVYGDLLIDSLKKFLEGMKKISVPTQLGPQNAAMIGLLTHITTLEQELDGVLSKKHFIEHNRG
jgi:hypothetical protein